MTSFRARIHPNEKRGSHTMRLSGERTVTFERDEQGRPRWYNVSAADTELLKKLETTRTQWENPTSGKLFQIVSPEEADRLDREELARVSTALAPPAPVAIDLPPPKSKAEFDKLPTFVKEAMERAEDMGYAARRQQRDTEKLLEQIEENRKAAETAREQAEAALAAAKVEREQAEKLLEQATMPAAPSDGAQPEAPPPADKVEDTKTDDGKAADPKPQGGKKKNG
jgi:hypothetical protein